MSMYFNLYCVSIIMLILIFLNDFEARHHLKTQLLLDSWKLFFTIKLAVYQLFVIVFGTLLCICVVLIVFYMDYKSKKLVNSSVEDDYKCIVDVLSNIKGDINFS